MAVLNSKLLPYISNHSCSHRSNHALIIQLLIFVLLFLMIPSSNSSAICQPPIPSLITSCEDTFGSYTDIKTYAVASGPVFNSLYFMFVLNNPSYNSAVRKTNSDGSPGWVAAFSVQPLIKSLAIDPDETYVYFGIYANPLRVCKIAANSGAPSDIQEISYIEGTSDDIKIFIMSNNLGYYIISLDRMLGRPSVCRYLFSTPSTTQCQKFPDQSQILYGQLKLTDDSFFIISYDESVPYSLHLYKATFLASNSDWILKIACPSLSCTGSSSESLLSSDSSKIYTFFIYGGSTHYLYHAALAVADGAMVSSRYRSDVECVGVIGSAMRGNNIIATVKCSTSGLMMFDLITGIFNFKTITGTTLYGCGVEQSTGRFVIVGDKSPNGYSTKFLIQDISYHPDFTQTTWSMSPLVTGVDDIVTDTMVVFPTSTTEALNMPPSTPIIVSYTATAVYIADVVYKLSDQVLSYPENQIAQITSNIPCSISGSTSITYAIGNYITDAPFWLTINTSTGVLGGITPNVTSDIEYDFYINSTISGVATPVQTLIKLTVLNCISLNCQQCTVTSISDCAICKTGYYLMSGACMVQTFNSPQESASTTSTSSTSKLPIPSTNSTSETAKNLSTTTTAIVVATTGCVVLASFTNSSSIASLWMTINQLQIFLLLLLTRAFIPEDIKTVLKGADYSSNIYEYIPLRSSRIYPNFLHSFEFKISNPMLEDVGINYDNTIANSYSFITCIIFMMIFHTGIYLLNLILSKCAQSENCCAKISIWIIEKSFNILTFGYYIRNSLEISQFILISSIYEVYEHNTTETIRLFSFIFAILMIFAYFSILLVINYLIFSQYELDDNSHNKVGEFFCNIKDNKKSRFYLTALLCRRFIFVMLLITLTSVSSKLLIGILIFLQLLYGGFIIYSRPYKDRKENIIEIINEIYFTLFLSTFMALNYEDDWNSFKISVYIWTHVSNFVMVFIIVFTYFIKNSIVKITTKCKNSQNNRDNNKIEPVSFQTPQTSISQSRVYLDRRSFRINSSISTNQHREENKYTVNESMPEIIIRPKKDWS